MTYIYRQKKVWLVLGSPHQLDLWLLISTKSLVYCVELSWACMLACTLEHFYLHHKMKYIIHHIINIQQGWDLLILIQNKLAYQPVHQILIRINIKIRLIANNYNYLSHAFFHILNSNTYYKIHIYYYLVAIDVILHHTSLCVCYILS